MRIIETAGTTQELQELFKTHARADYVYMYPPRQAYRSLPRIELDHAVAESLSHTGPVNLYLHFPFCRQICSFCNLYAVAGHGENSHAQYVSTLLTELDHYVPYLRGRRVETVYLGGGTPSVLDPALIRLLFRRLSDVGVADVQCIQEVAIEVAPDTVSREKFTEFREAGINRVNLGVQTWHDTELNLIGRRHGVDVPLAALEIVEGIGFSNVCVDLIYGLQGQSDTSWEHSLAAVIARRPETICAYPLTLRPRTAYAARGYDALDPVMLYARYDVADDMLTSAGYRQDTHVRWVLGNRGGYLQKTNHWAGHDIVGVGAGARGYLWNVDYRNGYSVRHREMSLREYLARVEATGHGRSDGFILGPDERRRRTSILGLGNLDREKFERKHQCSIENAFGRELQSLTEIGGLAKSTHSYTLTALGQRHRDILVQALFSPRVRKLVAAHDYDE